jgi:hypothetical protein
VTAQLRRIRISTADPAAVATALAMAVDGRVRHVVGSGADVHRVNVGGVSIELTDSHRTLIAVDVEDLAAAVRALSEAGMEVAGTRYMARVQVGDLVLQLRPEQPATGDASVLLAWQGTDGELVQHRVTVSAGDSDADLATKAAVAVATRTEGLRATLAALGQAGELGAESEARITAELVASLRRRRDALSGE